MKLGILNDLNGNYKIYEKSCRDLGIDYEIIDFVSPNWLNNLKNSNVDGLLVRPQVNKQVYKDMFDERLYFIHKELNIPMYPSFYENFIYEDKKRMSYFLNIHNIPHPKTFIFYAKEEALKFLETTNYPLVFKSNNGSAAIGVEYVKNRRHAKKLIKKVFTKGKFLSLGYIKWKKTRFGLSYPLLDDRQYNFIIFQEKIDVKVEWRIIKIGESYFGHQKLSDGKFHSGSLRVGWEAPPIELLDFAKKISIAGNFNSMGIDIFEDNEGNFFVNELQTIFGSHNDSQMYVEGVPGRFFYEKGKWVFEEGYFNTNSSFDLRVKDFLKKLTK